MSAFVLGNGTSRLLTDITKLRPYGKIYGCNALYREFDPDYLIAVDPKMIYEIQQTEYQKTHQVWTNLNSNHSYDHGFNYFNPRLGWSSGPSALTLATKHDHDIIYILGFDFSGINDKFNNVYAGTFNYKTSNDTATYWGNWQKQTEMVIKSNPHIKFYRVVEPNFYDTKWRYTNFKTMSYTEFNINISK